MRELLKPGDWITLLLGVALVSGLGVHFWSGPQGDTLIVRSQGKLLQQVSLRRAQAISVSGPLGVTLIEIQPGRARIARDPSPRQLCVKQGWLSRAGQVALCLPVEVSGPVRTFDSIAY